jgi:putative ABC transport system permease protein
MLGHYIHSTFRKVLKTPLFSMINIGGLALGFAGFLVITAYTGFDLSYDKFWQDKERIFRVEVSYHRSGGTKTHSQKGPAPAKPVFLHEFPAQVESATRILSSSQAEIRVNDTDFMHDIYISEGDFFKVFEVPFISGDAESSQKENNSVVLSESAANKFFGDQNPIGSVLSTSSGDYIITGVIEDFPANSHFDIDVLISKNFDSYSWWESQANQWRWNAISTYVKFAKSADIEAIKGSLDDLIVKYTDPRPDQKLILRMEAVTDIHHLNYETDAPRPVKENSDNYLLLFVAILILAVAAVNFVNLSTARATRYAKEISLRKIMGATRGQLITQFLTESIFLALLAVFLGFVLIQVLSGWIQPVLGLDMEAIWTPSILNLTWMFILAVFVGLAAGAYPALALSSNRPAKNLSSGKTPAVGVAKTRLSLTIAQFSAAICLMVCTIVVYQQTTFAKSFDVGFEKSGVIVLSNILRSRVEDNWAAFESEVSRNPVSMALSRTAYVPGEQSEDNGYVRLPDNEQQVQVMLREQVVEFDFFEALKIRPVAGRLFSPKYQSDVLDSDRADEQLRRGSAILNRSAVRMLGFATPGEALGQRVILETNKEFTIVGVIPDLSFRSIRQTGRPSIHYMDPLYAKSFALLRFNPDDYDVAMVKVNAIWEHVFPGSIMQAGFLEDSINSQYSSEDQWGLIFLSFSLMAMVISSLGLLGLAVLAVESKTKEVGIRKVLGATVPQIIKLFLWQLTKPVIMANLIAWPIAYWWAQGWLNGFAHRVDLSVSFFFLAGSIAFIIAWATVFFHSWSVASKNPIYSLRHE